MPLTPDSQPNVNVIVGIDAGKLKIRDQWYAGSLIVSATALHPQWPVAKVADIGEAHWQPLIAMAPEIVLLGSGAALEFASGAQLAPLYARRIGVEVMDTAAACRTYNVLISEGRAVAAALILGS